MIKDMEEDILQRSTTTRMKEMTFLERSALKSRASTPSFGGSVGLPLFGFLTAVRQSLEHWLNEDVSAQTNMVCSFFALFPLFRPTTSDTDGGKMVITRVSELLDLWRDMVELSSTHNLNESVFHVYLALLEDWLKQAAGVLPVGFVESTENALGNFRAPLQLTSGFSMELLWNDMRPSVPSSLSAWGAYQELYKIADRFDAVASRFKGNSFLDHRLSLATSHYLFRSL